MNDKSEIQEFFKNKNIFITGVSGFCGKVFLEKLLRACPEVGTIFVLIRKKHGQSVDSRVEKLFASRLFSFHRYPDKQLAKVVAIEGDITDDHIISSELHRRLLQDQVHLIFHAAASVRFDADVKTNLDINTFGTQRVLNFSKTIKHLIAFIHVSTAYSNCHLNTVEEVIVPLPEDIDIILEKFKSTDDEDQLKALTDQYLEGRPNSYVLTKAFAEHVVAKHRGPLQVAIVRPAIVSPSVREPTPGWVDSFNGPAGFSIVGALGIAQITDWEFKYRTDGTPVDFLANAMLTAAMFVATKRPDEISIYNLASYDLNPTDSYALLNYGNDRMLESPSLYVIRPPYLPPRTHKMSALEFRIKVFVYHYLFAYFIDLMLFVCRQKTMMLKIVKKMDYALSIMRYFGDRDWTFKVDNCVKLMDYQNSTDAELFDFDVRKVDPKKVAENFWVGCRRYLLKEDDSTIPFARMKLKVQTFLYKLFKLLLIYWMFQWLCNSSSLGREMIKLWTGGVSGFINAAGHSMASIGSTLYGRL